MLLERDKLNNHINKKIKQVAVNQDTCNKIYDKCFDLFNIPKGTVADYLSMRIPITAANNATAFAILKSIEEITNDKSSLPTFFTPQEIEEYNMMRYEKPTLKFPLVFNMIQITEDQWIGRITYEELFLLKNAQVINYNPATQRPLTSLKINDATLYVPTVNQKSVKEIATEFEQKTYIPTPITLNIPEDARISFGYDEKKNLFVIEQIPQKENGEYLYHLDIIDGYHRFLAGCSLNTTMNDFNYPMEFRIVNFSQEKAKRFIFQEDKQTKMDTIEKAAYNLKSPAYKVVEKLNESGNISGMIGPKNSLIHDAELITMIDYFFFKNEKYNKNEERFIIIEKAKYLKKRFNALTEYDNKYLTEKYTYRLLLTITFCAKYFESEPNKDISEIIDKTAKLVEASKDRKFNDRKLRNKLVEVVENCMKEAMIDVQP